MTENHKHDRDALRQQTEQFLRNGGTITQVATGQSGHKARSAWARNAQRDAPVPDGSEKAAEPPR